MMRKTKLLRLLFAAGAATFVVACAGAATGAGHSSSSTGTSSGSGYSGKATTGQAATSLTTQNATTPVPGEGPKVIRTANLSLEVRNGTFDSAYDNLVNTMLDLKGYVSGTDAQADTGALRSGTLTFQVPEASFQEALTRIRKLGTVKQIHVGGQDVSLQYVDLQARLDNAKAQRDQMLTLLQQAHSIQDIIAVQTQITQISLQIEQLQGQINYFDHATAFSSISVDLREAAVTAAAPDTWGFRDAASAALHGFVYDIDYFLVGLGYAAPFLILLAFGYLAWRWRRHLAL